jgi:hypothetical protein
MGLGQAVLRVRDSTQRSLESDNGERLSWRSDASGHRHRTLRSPKMCVTIPTPEV